MVKIKIIFMSDDISHQPTGYANESRQICFGLRDAGHEIVYIGCHSMQFEVVQYEGIKVHRVQGTGNKPVIQQILASEKPDLFITFWDLRKLMHVSYMDRFINCPWLMYYLLDDQPLPFEYFRMYRQPSLNIIPGSEFLYDLYQKQDIPTLDHVPLGTDMDVFAPLSNKDRQQLRKENLGDDADKVIFGFVGKNMPRKNVALLMEAFCALPEEVKNDSLLLLHTQPQPLERGPQGVFLHGHDLLNLKKFYFDHPNIRFTRPEGKIGFEMKYVYGLYDWQVSATYQEGWGKCTTEGMACGVPMIITGVSTADEICGNDWPWIVRPGATSIFPGVSINASYPNVQDFSDMMLKAYKFCRNSPEEYQRWRHYSRDRILDAGLDTPSVVKKWIEVIDSVKDIAGWENSYMFEEVVI